MQLRKCLRRTWLSAGVVVAWGVLWSVSPNLAQAQPSAAVTLTDTEDTSSKLPWRGTMLGFSQSLNVTAFSKSAQRSWNPTYAWQFVLIPRWWFNDRTFVSIDQRMALELTDSDTTLRAQRAMLSDTIVGVDSRFYDVPIPRVGSLEFTGGAHLIAPTSLSSRAATMTLGTRVSAGASMVWRHVLHGASLAVQGRYGHRFLRHNTVQAEQPYPCLPVSSAVAAQNCDFLGGFSNVTDSLATIISASLAVTDQLSVDLLVWLSFARGADLAPVSLQGDGYAIDLPDMSTTHWRNERYLLLGVTWSATDWLSVALSLIDYFSEKNLAGQNRGIGNPLDLMVGLTTSIAFDRLYLATRGHATKPMRRP